MAPNVSNYLFSGARGRILIVVTLLLFFVLFLSLRGRLPDRATLQAALHPYTSSKPAPSAPNAAPSKPTVDVDDDAMESSRTGLKDYEKGTKADQTESTKASPSKDAPKKSGGPSKETSEKSDPKTGAKSGNKKLAPPALQQLKTDDCAGFPDTSDVLLIMKTGATEAYDKLPIHFMSTLKCVKDFIIFSDMEMNMAGFHVRDVLAGLDKDFIDSNEDFELYKTLQEFFKEHQDPRDLKDGQNGWTLDKYKFVPMMKQTWDYRTDASWYVFIEADTFVEWENLLEYLETLDPSNPYYIGSPTYLDIQFAHGGTGYVISQGAMQKAVGNHPDLMQQYAREVEGFCCGDRMTAKILVDENIKLTTAWPMFNGEKPLTVPFGDNQWCQPVMTMHHLTAQEVSKMWNFQMKRKARGDKGPMVWKDVFDYFVKENLRATREDWENLSSDRSFTPNPEADFHGRKWSELSDAERASPESPEKCKALCHSEEACMQWMHHGQKCSIQFSIKLGKARPAEGSERWISGWELSRIQAFRSKMKDCPEIDWTTHPPE